MRLKNGIFEVPTAFSGERDEVLRDSRSAESLTEKVKLWPEKSKFDQKVKRWSKWSKMRPSNFKIAVEEKILRKTHLNQKWVILELNPPDINQAL